eukprot:g449.t1
MKRIRNLAPSVFQHIEKKYGNIGELTDTNISILTLRTNHVTKKSLQKLFTHQVAAVRVPNFFPKDACEILSETFLQEKATNWKVSSSRGMESSDVESIGTPYNVALGLGEEGIENYFKNARKFTRKLRINGGKPRNSDHGSSDWGNNNINKFKHIFPTLTPIDLLRLQLDETWHNGATIGKDSKSGRHLLAGAVRIMRGINNTNTKDVTKTKISNDGFIHVDDLSVMQNEGGLFSANIYLKTPIYGKGGELEIFPITFKSRSEFIKNAVTLSYLTDQSPIAQKVLRDILPRPLILTPEVGELILICAQRPHAAKGFSGQTGDVRVSMQTFLTYDEGKPIVIDN